MLGPKHGFQINRLGLKAVIICEETFGTIGGRGGILFRKEALLRKSKDSSLSLSCFCLIFVPGRGKEVKAQRHSLKLVLIFTPLQVVVWRVRQALQHKPARVYQQKTKGRSSRPSEPHKMTLSQKPMEREEGIFRKGRAQVPCQSVFP